MWLIAQLFLYGRIIINLIHWHCICVIGSIYESIRLSCHVSMPLTIIALFWQKLKCSFRSFNFSINITNTRSFFLTESSHTIQYLIFILFFTDNYQIISSIIPIYKLFRNFLLINYGHDYWCTFDGVAPGCSSRVTWKCSAMHSTF